MKMPGGRRWGPFDAVDDEVMITRATMLVLGGGAEFGVGQCVVHGAARVGAIQAARVPG